IPRDRASGAGDSGSDPRTGHQHLDGHRIGQRRGVRRTRRIARTRPNRPDDAGLAMTTRVLVAPDKFKGSLTAAQAAEPLAEGIGVERPDWAITELPVADGGDGTVAAAIAAGWSATTVDTTGPTGQPSTAIYAMRGTTAVVELASGVGLTALPDGKPDPLAA